MSKKNKRNNQTGQFEHQYKKTKFVVHRVTIYLNKLGWQARLEYLFSPAEFIAKHIDIELSKELKQLEDVDKF